MQRHDTDVAAIVGATPKRRMGIVVVGLFVLIPAAILLIAWADQPSGSPGLVGGTIVAVHEGSVSRQAPGRTISASVRLDDGTIVQCQALGNAAQIGYRVNVQRQSTRVLGRPFHDC